MNLSHGRIIYGKESITYNLIYAHRKTLEIAVYPDKTIIVKAPVGTALAEVEQRVLRRAAWIKKQIDYFEQFYPQTPPRRYLGGETHLYLGRSYRLKICPGDINQVKLIHGYFHVFIKGNITEARVKSLLDRWYAEKAASRFAESFERCWPCFEKSAVKKPCLKIRKMKKRWGSLSKNGVLTLNIDLIRAPRECIDYVVTHELCHLKHHNHGPGFYRQLDQVMPDWKKRKIKLELALV
jgi:predicted metal-dependent hydrolase